VVPFNGHGGPLPETLPPVPPVPATGKATVAESPTEVARHHENVVVGGEIVRHRLSSRVIHWVVALAFFLCLFTGLPIWTPIFGWMAHLFGGLYVCRWLHPWTGALFAGGTLVMFVHWLGEMRFEPSDKGWLGPKMIQYLKFHGEDEDVGKYNGGQKLFFFAVCLGTLALLASGIVLWFPTLFAGILSKASILLHDAVVAAFLIAIVFHIYLGTAAEPGTFHSMTRGTVDKGWAWLHHRRWYRQVTGEDRHRPD
jgi:formate dehydrogenase subunit gamma